MATIVPFQVEHKLNYFQISQIFGILIVSYDENLCGQVSLVPEPLSDWLLAVTY
jgi:hypothetical protein